MIQLASLAFVGPGTRAAVAEQKRLPGMCFLGLQPLPNGTDRFGQRRATLGVNIQSDVEPMTR